MVIKTSFSIIVEHSGNKNMVNIVNTVDIATNMTCEIFGVFKNTLQI